MSNMTNDNSGSFLTFFQRALTSAIIVVLVGIFITEVAIVKWKGETITVRCFILDVVSSSCGEFNPTPTPTQEPITGQSQSVSSVALELNAVLGEGNWFCFPSMRNAVGIREVDDALQQPILANDLFFDLHEDGMGAGTGWINPSIPSFEDCPAGQIEHINLWREQNRSTNISVSFVNSMLGSGNWQCGSDYGEITVFSTPSNMTTVQFPFIAVDENGTKHAIGETIPTNIRATFWLGEACPS